MNKNILKRILTLLLAMGICSSLSIPSFARFASSQYIRIPRQNPAS